MCTDMLCAFFSMLVFVVIPLDTFSHCMLTMLAGQGEGEDSVCELRCLPDVDSESLFLTPV